MTELQFFLLDFIRSAHKGRDRAITVGELVSTSSFGSLGERLIRKMIRDLNFDGYPILTSTHYPFGVYYAISQDEIEEYLCNLGSRMKAILERMKAIDKIKTQSFLKGQLELFG